jgi:succinate dehydrogenase/fumarate reductase-like Fe-S protein
MMESNSQNVAPKHDNPADPLQELEAIALALQAWKSKYPLSYAHLCREAISGSDSTLGDAESALNWASNYLMRNL